MKNKRILRRKKLEKLERKRLVRNKRRKNIKQHIANILNADKRKKKVISYAGS